MRHGAWPSLKDPGQSQAHLSPYPPRACHPCMVTSSLSPGPLHHGTCCEIPTQVISRSGSESSSSGRCKTAGPAVRKWEFECQLPDWACTCVLAPCASMSPQALVTSFIISDLSVLTRGAFAHIHARTFTQLPENTRVLVPFADPFVHTCVHSQRIAHISSFKHACPGHVCAPALGEVGQGALSALSVAEQQRPAFGLMFLMTLI